MSQYINVNVGRQVLINWLWEWEKKIAAVEVQVNPKTQTLFSSCCICALYSAGYICQIAVLSTNVRRLLS